MSWNLVIKIPAEVWNYQHTCRSCRSCHSLTHCSMGKAWMWKQQGILQHCFHCSCNNKGCKSRKRTASIINHLTKLDDGLVYVMVVETKKSKIYASADGGPHSRVCARETLRSAPHRHIWSFKTLGQLLKFSPKKTLKKLKTLPQGARGVSEFCWGLISPFFVRINPLWSFRN